MEKLWKIKELNNQPKMVKFREFFIKKHEALTGQKGDSTTQKYHLTSKSGELWLIHDGIPLLEICRFMTS